MRRLAPALPVLAGLLLAGLVLLLAPRTRLSVAVSPALLLLEAGGAATLVWWGARVLRRRSARRTRLAVEEVRVAGEDGHRRFVRRLDHELKNPLTALLAALAGPPGALPSAERTQAHVQAERIRRLLTDLRRVADAEVVDLDLAPVDVAAVLREAVDLAVDDAGGGRTVRVEVPTAPWPLPTVTADEDLLLVAVYNVVANALKYCAPTDVLEVRARETAGGREEVTIEVADTGPGIAEEHHESVWEELSRGDAPASVPGSGIGLALVRTIVERHGGRTELRSRRGSGTSVLLHLPATRAGGASGG